MRDLIDKLSWKLDNPALFNWHFISEAREPSDYFLKREPPNEQLDELRTQLAAVRSRFHEDAEELHQFSAGKKQIRVYNKNDCEAVLKGTLFVIGHEIFGPKLGRDDSPLIQFVKKALEPILGDDTPYPDALRAFHLRHKDHWYFAVLPISRLEPLKKHSTYEAP